MCYRCGKSFVTTYEMKKIVVLVLTLQNDAKEDHVRRLLQHFHILALAPEQSQPSKWILEVTNGPKNYLMVPFPYTENSINEGVTKINNWEKERGGLIDGIMPLADTAVEYAAALIEAINNDTSRITHLPGMSLETAKITRNKYQFRKLVSTFSKNIECRLVKTDDDMEAIIANHDLTFPALLKPAKGIIDHVACMEH